MKEELILYLQNVSHGALNLVKSVQKEDLNWKPDYGGRTVLELITHLSNLLEADIKMGAGELSTQELVQEFEKSISINSVESAVSYLESSIKYAINFFIEIEDDKMNDKKVKFFYEEEYHTYTHLLLELIEHLSLHKGILYSYLRQMGYNAGMGSYYGFAPAVKKS